MGDGFTKEKSFSWQKNLLFLLRANFPVTLQNLNSYSLVSEKCGQFLFSSEKFPHSNTDSMQIYCLIWVMGKWPQIQASLEWNDQSKIIIIFKFFLFCNEMVVVAILFAKSSRVFFQMFMRRHHFTFISQCSSVRKSAVSETFIGNEKARSRDTLPSKLPKNELMKLL